MNRNISELLSDADIKLLSASGTELIQQIGMDIIRGIVLDVLTGRNLRDSTEILTRRRVAALNLATLNLFIKGTATQKNFISQLPKLSVEVLTSRKGLKKTDKWLAQWMLGLTDKAFQNVLRDDPDLLLQYRDRYIEICREVISNHENTHGQLRGELRLESGIAAEMNWLFMTYLFNTIGAQTLAIRGSEKSAYGKLFEKLILGSLLSILGFEHIKQPREKLKKVFWLSSRGEKRESDATLLYDAGKGVRFDIGFIGRGNPEISLDKVTRFEREISLGRSRWYMATIIIVDRIGKNSKIEEIAKDVKGSIIQMSASMWPQQVARELKKSLGYDHPLVKMELNKIKDYLSKKLDTVPLEDFLGVDK